MAKQRVGATLVGLVAAVMLVLTCGIVMMPATSYAAEGGEERLENSWRYDNGELIEGIDPTANGIAALSGNDPWSQGPDGSFYNSVGEVIPNAVRKGIDVSHHQNQIDWNQVKASDVDFAIIRCGYGGNYTSQDDRMWTYNVNECTRLGIPFGVYIYSYAENTEDAVSEAEHVLRLVEGYDLDYPIYYDLEDSCMDGLSNDELAAIAQTFCDIIEANGYEVGIYANLQWFNNRLTDSCFDDWDRWVAQWNTSCTYTGKYSLWQATSDGSVPGIEGRVDINFEMADRPNDVYADAWYVASGAYRFVTDYGIMGVYTGTNMFGPNDSLTRGQVAVILWRLCGEPDVANSIAFQDVSSGQYYTQAVEWVAGEGLMTGYDDGRFGPNDVVTHEQLAVIAQRFGQTRRPSLSAHGTSGLSGLRDASSISSFATNAVNWCMTYGVYDDVLDQTGGYLYPTQAATRSEMASLLQLLYRDALDYPSDVSPVDWYVVGGEFDYAVDSGIMTGYTNTGLFGPYDTLTRGQVATILWRLAGEPSAPAGTEDFSDNLDSSQFYYTPVRWARSAGVISGYGDTNTFGPGDVVTREQLAVMLCNYAEKVERIDVSSNCRALDAIDGADDVSSWARAAMGWAVDAGLLSGVETPSGREVRPQDNANRAQMAVMSVNLVTNVL